MISVELVFTTAFFSLVVSFLDQTKIIILVAYLLLMKLIAYGRSSTMELNYDKKNKMFQKFVQTSKISTMKYEPYLFAPVFGLQGIFYMICEIFL